MKPFLITLILGLSFWGLQAQTKTIYYRNSSFEKVVPKDKAKYKIVRFIDSDTVISQSYRIKGNRFLTDIKTLDGKPTGIWYKYDLFGNLVYRKDFRGIVYSATPMKDPLEFKKGDPRLNYYQRAAFPGGDVALIAFLKNHMHYSKLSSTLGHSGKVVIQFLVEKDGTAVPNSIIKGVDPFLDLEAWQIIKKMPKWTPAHFKGNPVVSLFVLPIDYSLH